MKWDEQAYTRTDEHGNVITLEEYEAMQSGPKGRLSFLSKGEIKLLAIAGVGFFLDSYDLFIINLVTPIWTFQYWGGLDHPPKKNPHYPPLLRGLVNAGANIGNIIGQVSFGFLGDALGRKFVYGKELILCIFGMVMVISLPNQIPTPTLKMIWIFVFRVVMGVGIGGDYPMSASITSERTHLKRRGMLLGWIFSNQGWGTLAGSICTVIILACYEHVLNVKSEYSKLNGVWRIQMALPLIPALATIWPRLTMPEGKKYLESQELNYSASSSASSLGAAKAKTETHHATSDGDGDSDPKAKAADAVTASGGVLAEPTIASAKWSTFFTYFSEWRHLKTLLGTCLCWFLVDVSFYGTNLNQSVILTAIGFSKGKNEYHTLMKNTLGNLIIAIAGYVPGYLFTIGLIEVLGRKWIQIQGFLITALMFGILAGDFAHLGTAGKFVCLAFAQFFFNFGPNATTFIVPAEVFPSRVRGFAHGLSAAIGKLGAILAALLFNYLSTLPSFGLSKVLWIFFACNILGAVLTYVLLPETKNRDADVIDYEEWLEKNPTVVNTVRGQSISQ